MIMMMMMMTIIGLTDLASGKACGRYTGCTLCLLSGSGLNIILQPRHHHLHIPTIHHHHHNFAHHLDSYYLLSVLRWCWLLLNLRTPVRIGPAIINMMMIMMIMMILIIVTHSLGKSRITCTQALGEGVQEAGTGQNCT